MGFTLTSSIKSSIIILIVINVIFGVICTDIDEAIPGTAAGARKLSLEINPGCTSKEFCGNGSLIHVTSDSPEDSLHFVWNFFGCPSFLLVRTKLNAKLRIDWADFVNDQPTSVRFVNQSDVLYSFGWTLNKIWTFDDPEDKVRMDLVNQTTMENYDTKHFLWTHDDKDFINTTEVIKYTVISKEYDGMDFGEDGYAKITVQVKNTDGYSDVLPFMLHNGNSSQVDITLNKVNIKGSMTKNSRIGVGFLFVQQLPDLNGTVGDEDQIKLITTKTLNDEHSPGVFEMVSLRTPVLNEYDQSYLEWKPISYTREIRDITDSIDVIAYEPELQVNIQLDDTLLWSYYGGNVSTLILQASNMSFGSHGDKFYNATPHVSWTFMCGYGPPPADTVSMLVLITLAVGLGVPAIIIIIAIIYLVTKRLSTPNDELLLGR